MMDSHTHTTSLTSLAAPVLIVGAGLAGLSCANTLQRHGLAFILIEADSSVGGRMHSDTHHGFILDRGFQAFNTAYEEARHFLDFKALNLQAFYAGAVIRHNGAFHQVGDPFRDFRQLFTGLFSPIGTVKDKLLTLKLSLYAKGLDESAIFQTPEQTTLDFLQHYGFSETYIQQFFKPFYGGVFLESTLSTSVRKFLYTFKCFARGQVVVPRMGMQAIPQQLLESLSPEQVWLNQRVQSLGPYDPQNPSPRTLTLADGTDVQGSFVVLATPLAETFRLLNETFDVPQHATKNLYFSFEGPLPQHVVGSALYLNGEASGCIEHLCFISAVSPEYAPTGKQLVSVTLKDTALQQSNASLEVEVRRQLHDWFGACTAYWQKEAEYVIPHALPASTVFYGTEAPALQDAIHALQHQWNIQLASDALDSGSINGALRSGRLAALHVLKQLNLCPTTLKETSP
jgi:phytoene dehydrogenase-like protein